MTQLSLHMNKTNTNIKGFSETTDLPVLQKLTLAFKLWNNALSDIPKVSRYSLGEKISNMFIELIELILVATYTSKDDKLPLVQKASIKLDSLKFFVQIAWDLKAVNSKKLGMLSLPLGEAGKMIGGWKKQLTK